MLNAGIDAGVPTRAVPYYRLAHERYNLYWKLDPA
jgi:hypothetical protein